MPKLRRSSNRKLFRAIGNRWTVQAVFIGMLFFLGVWYVVFSKETASYDTAAPAIVAGDTQKTELVSLPPVKKPPEHIKTPSEVRAIYMTSWVAATPTLRNNLVSFIDQSEINSIVIDIKDYTGNVSFMTDDPVIQKEGSSEDRIKDIADFIQELHSKHIYVIGRVAVFQDPYMTKKHPELAVQKKGGGIWKDRKGLSFIDVGAKPYWDYIVHIAKASETVGFDEINFDYVRYPSDGKLSEAVFAISGGREKVDVLEDFFVYLHDQTANLGIPTSVDLFGLVTSASDDMGIGQVLERAAPHFDYVAPMIYPSHFASGYEGFKNPAEHPYEVIKAAMQYGQARLKAANIDAAKLRPWIQDFDLGADYGVAEVKAQQQAVYDVGLASWMSWDPSNKYTQAAYK